MAPNASRVLKRWGLLEKALEIGVQPKHLVFRDAVTGEELTRQTLGGEFAERYGAPYVVIHRSDLHRVLLEGCEAAGVTWSTTLWSRAWKPSTAAASPTRPPAWTMRPTS